MTWMVTPEESGESKIQITALMSGVEYITFQSPTSKGMLMEELKEV